MLKTICNSQVIKRNDVKLTSIVSKWCGHEAVHEATCEIWARFSWTNKTYMNQPQFQSQYESKANQLLCHTFDMAN